MLPQVPRARVLITPLGFQKMLLPPSFRQWRDDHLAQRTLVHICVEIREKTFSEFRALLALFEHMHIQCHYFNHLATELAAREHRAFLPVMHVQHILCKVRVVPPTELADKKGEKEMERLVHTHGQHIGRKNPIKIPLPFPQPEEFKTRTT